MRTRSKKYTEESDDEEKEVINKNKNLKQFDLHKGVQSLTHHPSILLIGQRHSGKNILMNELIYELDNKFK